MRKVRVRDICETYAGGTPDRGKPEFFGGSIRWVKSGEVVGTIQSTQESLTQLGLASSAAKLVEPGATLVAMYGATAGQVGRLAIRAATNQAVLAVIPKDVNEGDFVFHAISTITPHLLRRVQGSGQPNLNAGMIRDAVIPWPTAIVRRGVERALKALDETYHLLASQIERTRAFKRGLTQQLLTGQKRFPKFRDRPWNVHRFDALCEEISERNGNGLSSEDVMGVIKGVGFEPMRQRVRGSGDLSRYKVVPPYAFAYNPMRLNIGSIAYNETGRAILVSPDYEVFRARPDIAAPSFVNQLRHSWYWTSFMKRAGAGSVRVRIYFVDLARLRVPAPALDEQARIATVLELVDSELNQIAKLQDLVDNEKRALFFRLLRGDLEVSSQ